MTLSEDIRRVLREDGGWMTDRDICLVIDQEAPRLVRAYDVHTRLRSMVERGQVEMERPVDAPNRYRFVCDRKEPAWPAQLHVQRLYEARFPDGEFTASDLGRIMGVGRITASRHARRALADGILTSEKRGREVHYRRARRCSRSSSRARCAEARRSPGGTS